MPSYVIASKCDGCKAQDRTACQYICPNDLMTLDREAMKAFNRDPGMCWECFNCVKICPTQAVEVRGYSDFVPLGASVSPMRGTDTILWTVKFRDAALRPKRFRFPTRTMAEAALEPFPLAGATQGDLESPHLMGEPSSLDHAAGPIRHDALPALEPRSGK